MDEINNKTAFKRSIILLRVLIGWHFLFEGIVKWYNPQWTAKGYLMSSEGFLQGLFQWLASDSIIGITNSINTLVLLFVGFALILGYLERVGAIAGIGLLALYYLAQPAFPWIHQSGTEGNYWFVNKNLIELAALAVIYQIPTGGTFGITRLFRQENKKLNPTL